MSRKLIVNDGRVERELLLVGKMVVGRDPFCDVSDAGSLLSRRHAEFVASANEVNATATARASALVNWLAADARAALQTGAPVADAADAVAKEPGVVVTLIGRGWSPTSRPRIP